MRSNVGRRLRAGVELDVRVLKVLVANPGAVAVELTQSLRAGDWRSHLCVVHETDYEATSTVWYLQRADAQAVGDMTLSAFR